MKLVFVEWTGWAQGRTAPNYNKITGHHWFYLRNINVCVWTPRVRSARMKQRTR